MSNSTDKLIRYLRETIDNRFGGNQAEAARFMGIKPMTLSNWLSGQRSPSLAALEPVFKALGMEIHVPEEDLSGYNLIPKIEARPGAGSSLESGGETIDVYAFPKSFFIERRIDPNHMILCNIKGDSMFPLMKDGDMVMVDREDKEIMDGKIYILTLGEELLVKRVLRTIRGVILHSENPAYPDIPVEMGDLEQFIVRGRVRWISSDI